MPVDQNITVQQQAAQWHVLVQSGDMNNSAKQLFEHWMEDGENAEVYRRMETVWRQFDVVDSEPAKNTLKQAFSEHDKQKRKRRAAITLGSTVLVVFFCVLGWLFSPVGGYSVDYLLADHTSAVGEQRQLVLSDQTHLHLNTASAVNIEYSATQRTVYLLQGEVYLDVAKDAARPLVVVSKHGSSRALGTQFMVRDRGATTEVTVTESLVEACTKFARQAESKNTVCKTLEAGEQTLISSRQVGKPEKSDPAFVSEWTRQQLIVDNQPLLGVLDELARYRKGYMHIDRSALAGLKVSGVFPLNDTDSSLQVITRSLPVKVKDFQPFMTMVVAE